MSLDTLTDFDIDGSGEQHAISVRALSEALPRSDLRKNPLPMTEFLFSKFVVVALHDFKRRFVYN